MQSAKGIVTQLKARLCPDEFGMLQSLSKQYQHEQISVEDYYDTATSILRGDTYSLHLLVDKLPNAERRKAFQEFHAALISKCRVPGQGHLQAKAKHKEAKAGPDVGTHSGHLNNAQPDKQVNPLQRQHAHSPTATQPSSQVPVPVSTPWLQHVADMFAEAATKAAAVPSSITPGATAHGTNTCVAGSVPKPTRPVVSSTKKNSDQLQLADASQQAQASQHSSGSVADADAGAVASAPKCTAVEHSQEDERLCSVCLDAQTDVQLRPCRHLLCKGCLQEWQRQGARQQGPATCPLCRAPIHSYKRWQHAAEGTVSSSTQGAMVPRLGPPVTARPVVVWLRKDLRLRDNLALNYACKTGAPCVLLYIWAPQEWGPWPPGGATKLWLHHSLGTLSLTVRQRYNMSLLLYDAATSSSEQVVRKVARQVGAQSVAWSRVYEPWAVQRDNEVETSLLEDGITVKTFCGSVLYEPWDALPDQLDAANWRGGYGSVGFFTSACQRLPDPPCPVEEPKSLRPAPAQCCPQGVSLAALGLARMPTFKQGGKQYIRDWAAGIRETWCFGESGAQQALRSFLADGAEHFQRRSKADTLQSTRFEEPSDAGSQAPKAPFERFRADRQYTARISPYMAMGELSPRQVYHDAFKMYGPKHAKVFLRRLAWRDLAYWALWRFPHMVSQPLRPQYEHQRWDLWWQGEGEAAALWSALRRWDPTDPHLKAWQRGETGFPLVDAGMRELWHTGYICNYMRHIVAGFLIEYLNIDWRHGALWFHDTLCDADVAINAFMWQNGGHSGADQWNFVMHPVFAAKAADPEGEYVRRWVPELSGLSVPYLHAPWEAPRTIAAAAGVVLGWTYPKRIITDLEAARCNSLAAVVELRRSLEGSKYVLLDGNEALPLPDGRFARAITRIDYRLMAEKPVTVQAAADLWDVSRRPSHDPLAVALRDTQRHSIQEAQRRQRLHA